jgi:hypothetical protein
MDIIPGILNGHTLYCLCVLFHPKLGLQYYHIHVHMCPDLITYKPTNRFPLISHEYYVSGGYTHFHTSLSFQLSLAQKSWIERNADSCQVVV